jgi:hypothetical protein
MRGTESPDYPPVLGVGVGGGVGAFSMYWSRETSPPAGVVRMLPELCVTGGAPADISALVDLSHSSSQLRDDVGHDRLTPYQLGLQLLAQDGQRGRLPREGAVVLGANVEFLLVPTEYCVFR